MLSRATIRSRNERLQFLKRFLDLLPSEELEQVSNMASKEKKRRVRKQLYNHKPAALSAPETAGDTVSVSVQAALEPDVRGWFRKFKKTSILALDVEKVEVPCEPGSRRKFDMMAAKVALVNMKEEVVYQAIIQRSAGSFRVTKYSLKVNGITATSLSKGKPIYEVQQELDAIMNNKLVIGVDLENDFNSLGLPMSDYSTFDLQWYFYKFEDNILSKLGLRSLCKHYFNIDMQQDAMIHSEIVDATWTIRLFRDVYVLIKPEPDSMYNPNPCNWIEHFKKLWN